MKRFGLEPTQQIFIQGYSNQMANQDSNSVPEIDVLEAKRRVDEGAFFIDVREQNEYDEEHIPGATLVPLSEFMRRYEGDLPEDKNEEVVVHCRSGARSAQAVTFLRENGYNAVNVEGGILAWKNADLPTERSS